MSNQEIAEVLEFISEILKAKGANRFRAVAYENAATSIKLYPKELHEMFLNDPDFDKIPGIGETLNQKLTELFTTGNIKALQKYVADVPAGTYALVKVHGIGGKRALFLAEHFGLFDQNTAVAELLEIAKQGKIQGLPNLGEKRENEIIEQLSIHTQAKKRISYNDALQIANEIIGYLIKNKVAEKVEVLGSLRRKSPTIGDIDLGVVSDDMGLVKNVVKNMQGVERVDIAGEQLVRLFLDNGVHVDIKTVPKEEWGAFLQHFTGSKEHNIKLREFALEKNLSLSEHGIKVLDPQTGKETKLLTFATEEAFYNALGLRWIPPEERIGKNEIKKYQSA